ncbi:hypothetical protein AAG570_005471 [Ranatra chinensis]|uniref:Uncharacterized protein n=1 Tax=Ranatra chinensis TaxID=642074 RepID=A0ABD0XXI8_9HEMI
MDRGRWGGYPIRTGGCCALGVGVWTIAARHQYLVLLTNITYPLTTYVLTGAGALSLVVALVGCCSVHRENRCCVLMLEHPIIKSAESSGVDRVVSNGGSNVSIPVLEASSGNVCILRSPMRCLLGGVGLTADTATWVLCLMPFRLVTIVSSGQSRGVRVGVGRRGRYPPHYRAWTMEGFVPKGSFQGKLNTRGKTIGVPPSNAHRTGPCFNGATRAKREPRYYVHRRPLSPEQIVYRAVCLRLDESRAATITRHPGVRAHHNSNYARPSH